MEQQVTHGDLSRRGWSEAMLFDDDGVKCSLAAAWRKENVGKEGV